MTFGLPVHSGRVDSWEGNQPVLRLPSDKLYKRCLIREIYSCCICTIIHVAV
jgi:hypothetical protein